MFEKVNYLYTLMRFETLDSTMEEARRFIRAHQGTLSKDILILAHKQTHGRGRRGRTWISEPGNLHLSLVIPLREEFLTHCLFSYIAAVALRQVIARTITSHSKVLCKWPNDILIDGAKVAGVLLEGEGSLSSKMTWLIIGVGVNILSYPKTGLRWPSTCLQCHDGKVLSAEEIAAHFYNTFYGWYKKYRDYGFEVIRQEWLQWAYRLGEPVVVHVPHQDVPLEGEFCDLDLSGACVLETKDKGRQYIYAGDFGRSED